MKHALVVGGTGMLADVTRWLVNQGYHVSVIGRNPVRMNHLITSLEKRERITPLVVDYRNDVDLLMQINRTVQQNGPIELVVAWIHSVGKKALNVISKELADNGHPWRLFHILGSSSNLEEFKQNVGLPHQCKYRQIQLGFFIESGISRWLTHEEICTGIKEAIINDSVQSIVGILEPWEKRP